MDRYIAARYNPANLIEWLDKHPIDVLQPIVSDTRPPLHAILAWWVGGLTPTLPDMEIKFNDFLHLNLNKLHEIVNRHALAIHQLVVIGYRYWKPPEERNAYGMKQDFDFQIKVTENFDAPQFAQKHLHIPPMSMLLAICNAINEYAIEMAFYLRLLCRPSIRENVQFTVRNKCVTISIVIDGLLNDALLISQLARTGIAYVNAKTGRNKLST